MRALISMMSILFCMSMGFAGEKQYGKELTLSTTTKISDILAAPEKFNKKRVLVEGTIVAVCEERGCWMKLASDKEFESITFKVDDGVIVFPLDAKGKTARAEGVVSVKSYTKEELIASGKKHAEKEKKEFDPLSVKGPKTVVLIKGEGAVID